uniref:NudC domain-containing protein 1 n=1 Tax=Panagrellus redivivus TaxID=6233 RepID=A0A7E4V0Z1_PANRE
MSAMMDDPMLDSSDSFDGEIEQIEIKTNPDLINATFEKYIVAEKNAPLFKGVLPTKIKIVKPTNEQTSRQELKLFTLVQPLVLDLYNSSGDFYSFYYIGTDNCLWNVQYNAYSKSYSKPTKITFDHPYQEMHSDDHALPWSMKFVSDEVVVVADGLGRMVLAETGNRKKSTQWKVLESYHLLKNGTQLVCGSSLKTLQPFIISDTRDGTGGIFDVVITTVMKKMACGSAVKRAEGAVATHIYWINFVQTTVPGNHRVYIVDGNFEFCTLNKYFNELIVVSTHHPRVIYCSGKPTEVKPDEALPPAAYTWSQTSEKVTVEFDLRLSRGDEALPTDVEVEFKPKQLSVKYKGNVLLEGELFDEVKVEECKFELGRIIGTLKLTLPKANEVRFTELIPTDSRGRQVIIEDGRDALNNPTINVANPDQLEDIDTPDEHDHHIITWNSSTVTKMANLSHHQILYTAQNAVNEPIGIAFRNEVDAVFFAFDNATPRHVYTIDAFGYIQASKTNRRFTVASPDGNYGAIVDDRNHAFVYIGSASPSPGSTLQNTRTKKIANVAVQHVVSLATVDEDYASLKRDQSLVAAIATNKILFIATDWAIFAVHVV